MSKVIDIEDRLKLEQKKKAKVDKAKKMEAVRKVVQCTRCLARCAKCGIQFDTTDMYKRYTGSLPLLRLLPGRVRRLSPDQERRRGEPLLLAQPGVGGPVADLGRLPAGHEGLRGVPGIHRPGAGSGMGPVSRRPRPRAQAEVADYPSPPTAVGVLEDFHGQVEGLLRGPGATSE